MNREIEKRNEIPQKYKAVFSFSIVLMIWANVYTFVPFPALGCGEVFLIVISFYLIIMLNNKIKLFSKNNGILFFMIYGFITTLVMISMFDASIPKVAIRMARDFFYYFIIIFLGANLFDITIFKKWCVWFCLLLAVFIIVQTLVYYLLGYFIPGFPLNIMINDGGYTGQGLYDSYLSYANIAGYIRPNGFLCEPSHCAQCFLVCLILILFDDGKIDKTKISKAVLVTVGAVLTMSTSAIIYILFIWINWLVKEGKYNIIKTFIIIIATIIAFVVLFLRGNMNNLLAVSQRFTNLFTGGSLTASSEVRMTKGINIFSSMPFIYKLFGIGFGTYSYAYDRSIISKDVFMANNEYMNTFAYILVSAGIIGMIIIATAVITIYIRSNRVGRMMILALIVMSLGSSIYSSPICVWLMLVIINSHYNRHKNNVECYE
ncbi:hypothetical protein SAMN02910265_01900 [Ruminococcus flavefaciens]|uniref:O-antigen ligase like membrane protein n=1 Tax=Ruminococcus flavefaciens TaxID=1265 RepID=A0A1H6JR12_RUMFL|nr:hypothetical protein [Ruminococcus flavefaciens]SEH64574.1 hypothetical protein SAMN02910265_01900 [Ruminococcus flavefaciens]